MKVCPYDKMICNTDCMAWENDRIETTKAGGGKPIEITIAAHCKKFGRPVITTIKEI